MRKYRFIITIALFIWGLGLWDACWIKAEDRALAVNTALDHFEGRGVPEPRQALEKQRPMIDVLSLKNADTIDVFKRIAKKIDLNVMPGRGVTKPRQAGKRKRAMIDVLNLKDTAIIDVFKRIAKKIDLNVMPGRGVPEPRQAVEKKRAMIDVLDLKNADIIDVLKIIAEKSGLNIMAGRNVKGRVSMYFKNIAVMDALQVILDSHGLAFSEAEGIVRVMTEKDFELKYGYQFGRNLETSIVPLIYINAQEIAAILTQMKGISGQVVVDKSSNSIILKDTRRNLDMLEDIIKATDVPRVTEVFELTYGSAEEVSAKISEMLTQNIGRMVIDERSNKIIVTDISERIDEIAAVISVLDEKEKEVLIEAKIIQVILSDDYKMGVDWDAVLFNYHGLALTSDFDILESSDKRGTFGIGTLANDNYSVLLQALETVGTTNILSNPRITVLNNKEAKILVGSTEPYITSTTITPASGATTTAESVNFIEVGVKLYVTPIIHRDGFITMKIKPEVSSVVKTITTSNNNTIPVIETSEAETTVMIKDGATIVIGGLIKDENIRTEKKIPFLGDIPFLGMIFRNVDDSRKKTEMVIFLTPRIISGEEEPDPEPDILTQLHNI